MIWVLVIIEELKLIFPNYFITPFQVVHVMSAVQGTANISLVFVSVMKMSLGMTVANVLLITGALLHVRYGMVYTFSSDIFSLKVVDMLPHNLCIIN